MGLTDRQIELRENELTASVMAVPFDLHPWITQRELWLTKTKRAPAQAENQAMRMGSLFEDMILTWAGEQLGTKLRRNQRRVSADCKRLAATLDSVAENDKASVEAKKSRKRMGWGEPGTDEVPAYVTIQTHVQIHCQAKNGGPPYAWVAAYLTDVDRLELYKVDERPELTEAILERADAWWDMHVVRDLPPTSDPPSHALLSQVVHIPAKVAEVEAKLVETWRAIRERRLLAEKAEEYFKREILWQMGDAELGAAGEAGHVIMKQRKRKGYTVEPSVYSELQHKKEALYLPEGGVQEVIEAVEPGKLLDVIA